jgi:lipoprotein NlpD
MAGCGSSNKYVPYAQKTYTDYSGSSYASGAGVYHKVKKGETLWRISKNYGIELKSLIEFNDINDVSSLEIGQLIFIPNIENKINIAEKDIDYRNIKVEKDFILPVKGRIKIGFGEKKGLVNNKGIDISASEGALVIAVKSGVVSFTNNNMRGLGKLVIIDHQDGFITVYAHLANFLIKNGDIIKQGQTIGLVGRTGSVESPVLHFEIRKDGKTVNPCNYLKESLL